VTTILYDEARGELRPIRTTNPDGQWTATTYVGALVSSTSASTIGGDPVGTTYTYDAAGHLTTIAPNDGPTTQLTVDYYGHVDAATVGGEVTHFYRDARGRDTLVVDPGGHRSHVHFDPLTQNADSVLADGSGTGTVAQFSRTVFDVYGRDSVITSSSGQTVRRLYDALNRTTTVDDGRGGMRSTTNYDTPLVTVLTDAAGHVFRYTRNALGAKVSERRPGSTSDLRTRFDVEGLVTGILDRRGQPLTITYDSLHRVQTQTSDVGTTNFSYSSDERVRAGQTAVAVDSVFTSAVGWVDSSVTWLAGQRFRRKYVQTAAHDLGTVSINGPSTIAFADRTYSWNNTTGVLDAITVAGQQTTFGYTSPEVFRQSTTWPIGVTRTESYTSRHQLSGESFNSSAAQSAFRRDYAYDGVSSRLQSLSRPRTNAWDTQYFQYDSVGRMNGTSTWQTSTTRTCSRDPELGMVCSVNGVESNGIIAKYTYDPVGNISAEADTTPTSSSQITGSYESGSNRLTAWALSTFTHDDDGNRLGESSAARSPQFGWASDGSLRSVTVNGQQITFDYDASGQLVRKSVNGVPTRHYLWDGGQLLATLDGTATQRIAEYAYLPGVDRPFAMVTGQATPTVHYIVQDVTGNVTGVLGASGTVEQSITYDAWGLVQTLAGTLGDETNALRFKGLLWDQDAALYYVRNRWYDPATRRFVSEDPAGAAGGTALYSFANDDPINRSDPSGMISCAWLLDLVETKSLSGYYDCGSWGAQPTVYISAPRPQTPDVQNPFGSNATQLFGQGNGPGGPGGQRNGQQKGCSNFGTRCASVKRAIANVRRGGLQQCVAFSQQAAADLKSGVLSYGTTTYNGEQYAALTWPDGRVVLGPPAFSAGAEWLAYFVGHEYAHKVYGVPDNPGVAERTARDSNSFSNPAAVQGNECVNAVWKNSLLQ
jgi:RHS repeat-associated protein